MSNPIRILHVVTDMRMGGLETLIMNYYRNIDREKVQFDFLVHRKEKAVYDDEIISLGGKIFTLPRLNPFSLDYHKKLNNFFKDHPEYKIVHVHQDCLSSIALKSAKKNNVSVRIGHSHSSNQDRNFKYIIKKYYMRSIPKYATELFACSKMAGDWMFRGSTYKILSNAVDAEKFVFDENVRNKLKKDLVLADDELVIGHVGRFNWVKNHDYLIDVFAEILKMTNNKAKLILVGKGDLEEAVRNKAERLGIEDYVIFMGNRSDIYNIMQVMDVFVMPSHYEGLPVTLVEAQASGLKCVISDKVPEQSIFIKELGKIVQLDSDAHTWAESIIDFADNYERKNTYKQICETGFDIKSNAQWLENYYLEKHYNNLYIGD